jgi:putative redox protein
MVEIRAVYEGDLRCRLTHGPSGQTLVTDAPKDHYGKGEAFSPTDLAAAALGSCLLTTMGIVAMRHQIDLGGTTAHVKKEMKAEPSRRIGKLSVAITFARQFPEEQRRLLEQAALSCPVHHSLHPEVEAPVDFVYPT